MPGQPKRDWTQRRSGPGPIALEWAKFMEQAMPTHASDIQKSEMRKAFYFGATMLFRLVMSNLSEGDDATPQDEAFMGRLSGELAAFMEDVKAGRA